MSEHPLANWRSTNKKSQKALAADLKISRWMVNAIETGRRKPSLDTAKRIEDMTGIARRELLPDLYEALQ